MSDVMAIGLSTDTVANDMAKLMRLRISAALQIPLDAIQCHIYLSGKKVSPEFSVDQDHVKHLDGTVVVDTIRLLWSQVKCELEDRLRDLRTYRGRYEAQKEAG